MTHSLPDAQVRAAVAALRDSARRLRTLVWRPADDGWRDAVRDQAAALEAQARALEAAERWDRGDLPSQSYDCGIVVSACVRKLRAVLGAGAGTVKADG